MFLARISCLPSEATPDYDPEQERKLRQKAYSHYIIGLIKGALRNLGVSIGGKQCSVTVGGVGEDSPQEPNKVSITIVLPNPQH